MDMGLKNVKIEEEVWKELAKDKIESGIQKISDIIKKNSLISKKFANEKQFREWFKNNYKSLGFSKILIERSTSFPDFRMLKHKKELEVELETLSSHFLLHKHDPQKVDLVLCLVKDIDIGVETIELQNLFYIPDNKTASIRISNNLKRQLTQLDFVRKHTFEEIIRMLIDYYKNKKTKDEA